MIALIAAILAAPVPAATVGQPADIAASAYLYRADRPPLDNPPESWLALVQYAGLPYDKPVNRADAALRRVLCSLLWEEVRPLRRLHLTWPAGTRNQPLAECLEVTCFDAADDTAHTWWNPRSLRTLPRPQVSPDGRTLTYDVPVDTWGVTVALPPGVDARDWAVPSVQAFVEDTWKSLQVEVEWAYESAPAGLSYDGSATAYDGVIAGLRPLPGDRGTTVAGPAAWRSAPSAAARRGVRFSLQYIGQSGWRRVWPYAAQEEDVARTIVTIATRAGSFSFLAADLENGPILAPEYGFFVRAVGLRKAPPVAAPAAGNGPPGALLATRMDQIPGVPLICGWANDTIPWFGVNASADSASAGSLTIPPHCAAMHPLPDRDVAAGWRSPVLGEVSVSGRVAMADAVGSNGVDWSLISDGAAGPRTLASGQLATGAAHDIAPIAVSVLPGDFVSLVIGPRDRNHYCDTTIVELAIVESAGQRRTWSLSADAADNVLASNPQPDSLGNPGIWWFYSPPRTPSPADPPFVQASRAGSAREFIAELRASGLTSVRQRTRTHAEQSWGGAVRAMHPTDLPPHPTPDSMPAMQVEVPDARLTAQWNLGAFHILRRSAQSPAGQWRFNDYPFGILASETYLILRALDLQGMHKEAADGLEQWLSLPLKHNIIPGQGGQHPLSKPDRPLGHFSDGDGCLTLAEGIDGAGGHMDGVHCMGPGAIGFALAEHARLSGDAAWLKAAAPRMLANADWILRQRKLLASVLPGGERLWSRGLQPAHVVTPDSMCMHMQFYESEAYYWLAVKKTADLLASINPVESRRLAAEAAAYRQDILASVNRSIALTPVVATRDGTYHSFVPFAPYVRGFAAGAWGWRRCQGHVGAIYWDTVQSADPLISPSGLLAADDPRVQGHLDVLEDRLLLENPKLSDRTPGYQADRDWFSSASWQYQCGLERHANIHLAADDVPCFLRTWLNQYAVDIMPGEYTFREHTTGGPPDKLFEESAFLERFRMALVMEEGGSLWLARATPREWLAQGKRIAVSNAPTWFGPLSYEITSDVDNAAIRATVAIPSRTAPAEVLLRLRHPAGLPLRGVRVNGKPWGDFNPSTETIRLAGLSGEVRVEARY